MARLSLTKQIFVEFILRLKKLLIPYLVCLPLISVGAYLLDQRFALPRGLEGKYYANPNWQGDPRLVTIDPEISKELLTERRREFSENRFSIEWNGFVVIERSGKYTFATASDDGSWLYINHQLVVDNGGTHGLEEARGQIYLEAGVYPIRVRYFQAGGYYRLHLSWAREDRPLEDLPSHVLSPHRISYQDSKLRRGLDHFVVFLKWVWLGTLATFIGLYLFKWIFIYKLYPLSPESGLAILLLVLVILFFFYDIIFLDYSLLTSGYSSKPFHVIDPVASSAHHEPLVQFASRTYKQGLIPLWIPHYALGSPLNANMQSAVFFPLNFPLFLRPSPEMWDLFMILRILIAGILAYFFFHHFLSLGELAAFVGAVAFMFSGHIILNLNVVYINAVVLLPGLLYVSEMLLRTPNVKNLTLTGVLIGLIILGGHPESTFFVLFYASGYYLFRCVTSLQEVGNREQKTKGSMGAWEYGGLGEPPILLYSQTPTRLFFFLLKRLFCFAGATFLGFLLSSVMLVPFLEFVKVGTVGLHDAKQFKLGLFSLSPSRLFGLWVPYFWGPLNDTWDGSVWQFLPGYIGVIVAIFVVTLLIQGLAFEGKFLFFTGMVFFFLIKGYGLSTTFNEFIGNLPMFRVSFFTRYFPGEFMFSTAALAGMFTQRLIEGRIRMKYLGLSIFLGLASVGLLLWLNYSSLLNYNKLDYALQQILTPVILCLVAGIGFWLRSRKLISSRVLASVLGLLLTLELFIWMPKAHDKRSNLISYGDPPSYIKFIQQDPEIFRVYGLDSVLYPNTASNYGLDDVGYLDAVVNIRYLDFSLKLIRFYIGYFDGFNVPNVENRFFSFLNLKYVITSPWTPAPAPFFTRVYQRQVNIYRNEHYFPRAFIVHQAEVIPDPEAVIQRLKDEAFDLRKQIILEEEVEDPTILTGYEAPPTDGSTAEIVTYTPTRVIIKTHMEHAGFLVLSDAYFPGWKVFVDGVEKKIYLTDYLIRSVFVDQGVHIVEFIYQPVSYKLGAWLTLIGCSLVTAAWAYSRNKT